jgi:hypothetical protein
VFKAPVRMAASLRAMLQPRVRAGAYVRRLPLPPPLPRP